MIEALKAKNLSDVYGVRHAFFTRKGGVSRGVFESLNCGLWNDDDKNAAIENRRLVALYLEAKPENVLSCNQVHSPDVVTVTEPWPPTQLPKADAMVTKERGIVLGVLTADCVPILFADEKAGVIGAAHAGWRGALIGIIENTIKAMESLGANTRTIQAALGPCIAQNSYEVGPEFPAPFLAEKPEYQRFFRPSIRPGHYMFDLPSYVMEKLRAAGVGMCEPPPGDTCADEERFFSYRRNFLRGEKSVGSLMSAIMLIPILAPPVKIEIEEIEKIADEVREEKEFFCLR